MNNCKLLRYDIDSWDQLPGCLSNNSRHLHLTYDVVIDKPLTGGVIRVEHDRYGCLFSYVVQGSGNLLSSQEDGTLFELTTGQILSELRKFGFIVSFSKTPVIDDDQFKLLCTVNDMGLSKIRVMYVDVNKHGYNTQDGCSDQRTAYLVAFNEKNLPIWLSNCHYCSEEEFKDAVVKGYCVNLTYVKGGLQPSHNWVFLTDKVLNVVDLLESAR